MCHIGVSGGTEEGSELQRRGRRRTEQTTHRKCSSNNTSNPVVLSHFSTLHLVMARSQFVTFCEVVFFAALPCSFSTLFRRWGSVGILALYALRSTGPWLTSMSPLSAPSLASLTPAAPPAPPQSSLHPLQTLLDCSLTTHCCQQLFNEPPPPLPSFPITFLNPYSCVTHNLFHSTLVQPPPSQLVAAGSASVTQMHVVAVGTRHGNKASARPFCCSFFVLSVCV